MNGTTLDYVTTPKTTKKLDKITRYGWEIQDKPGTLKWISKHLLEVDGSYQREHNRNKAREMASNWSWVACGTIIVGFRAGVYYVIDGQHRVIAALFRSDIIDLPCIVFDTQDNVEEAKGFLNANTLRKPVRIIDKYRAQLTSKDELAEYVNSVLDKNGIVVKKDTNTPKSLHAIGSCFKMAKESREDFEETISLISDLCADEPIHEILLTGIYYLVRYLDVNVHDKRFRGRVLKIGARELERAAKKAAAYYVTGGMRIYALGMRDELNRGLRTPFSFKSKEKEGENGANAVL